MTADKKAFFLFISLMLFAALIGMGLVYYSTTYGPGVGGDATIYLTSAKNLLAGKGLGWIEADGSFRLLPYTPPGYPLALSIVGLITSDLVAGARWLNILLFGLTIVMAGWTFYRFTRRPWLAAVLSGLAATSPVIIGVEVWAMSEALFLFLGFAGLFLLLEYYDCPRPLTLIGAAVVAGLAFLTRYIGVAFVATGGLALLLLHPGEPRARLSFRWKDLRPALLYGVIACLPILVWLVIDVAITGTVGSRSAQPAEAYWQRFLEMGPALLKIYLFWLLPESKLALLPGFVQTALWIAPLLAIIGLAVILARRLSQPVQDDKWKPLAASVRLAVLMGLFIIVYLVVLAGVQVFTYPPVTLAARMLSPVHFAVLILVISLLDLVQQVLFPRWRRAAPAFLLAGLALLGMYALRGAQVANGNHRTGLGYTSPYWLESGTVAKLRNLPPDVPLISNETTAITFLTGRLAHPLKEIYQDKPLTVFTAYGSGDDDSQRVFREKGGALVLFSANLGDDFGKYGDRASERINALKQGLFVYYDGEDGSIYFYSRPAFLVQEPCD